MIKNTILSASVLLSAVLAMSIIAKADFDPSGFAQTITPKMQLDEGIKALKANDNQGAQMHLGLADQILSGSG